jgi:FemAB-related protein (PEP-CTERM system-associated)
VESEPAASVYHHPRWLRTIEASYRLSPFHLLARTGGRVSGFLPLYAMRTIRGERVGVSSPFSNYGGPLAADADTAQRLLEAAAETAARERWSYLELKHRHAGEAAGDWPRVDHFCSPVLDLRSLDVEEIWAKKLRGKTRNQVRKAQKSGLELREGLDREFDDFLLVYAESMRDLGTPGHGKAWFANLREQLGSRLLNLVAYQAGRPIGGALLLREPRGAILQYCLCLRDSLASCPNNLLYWGAIERGVEAGWEYLDFGRSRIGEGTYAFKLQWGAEPVATPYVYHLPAGSRRTTLPDLHPANPAFDWFIRAWQALPVRLTQALGPRIRPHLTT